MKQLLRYAVGDDQTIVVEVDAPDAPGAVRAGRVSETITDAKQSFEQALDTIKPVAAAVLEKLRELPHAPDEATVKFSLKLATGASAIVASASIEGNFEVALTWRRHDPAAGSVTA